MALKKSISAILSTIHRGLSFIPWKPSNITDAIWLDAKDSTITTSGGDVSEWQDSAGGSIHATQTDSTIQPSHNDTEKRIEFDGTEVLTLSSDISFTECSIFIVAEGLGTNSREHITRKGTSTWTFIIRYQSGSDLRMLSMDTNGNSNDILRSGVGTAKSIISFVADNTGLTTRLNGGDEQTDTTATGDLKDVAKLPAIGAEDEEGDVSDGLNGRIWQYIFIPHSISDADARRVEGFLAHEEGLASSLPDVHPYKDSPPKATYADIVKADNPIAYWRFEDLSSAAIDEIGSNDGTLGSGSTNGSAIVKNSLQSAKFDGASDSAITVSYDSSLKPTGDKLSIETWINTTDGSSDTRRIIEFENGGPWILFGVKSGGIRFSIDTGSVTDLDSTLLVNDGNNHYVVGTYDGSTMRIYIDGTEDTSASKSGNLDWTTGDDIIIGSDNLKQNSRTFNGNIDELAIYDFVLSTSQLSEHYDKGKVVFSRDWNRRIAITIDHTQISTDSSNSSSLNDQTLIIDKSFDSVFTTVDGPLDADGAAPMQADGGDIRASTDIDGNNQLAVDVRNISTANDPSNGELEIAIGTFGISSTEDTTIYLWYNSPIPTSQPDPSHTFGQYNAYNSDIIASLTFNEDPSTTAPQLLDRTSTGEDGTSSGAMTSGDSVDGIVGNALDFDGSDDAITISGDTLDTTSQIGTLEVWAKSSNTSGTESIFFTKENRNRHIYNDSGTFKAAMFDGDNIVDYHFLTGPPVDNNWHQFVLTWDITQGRLEFFVDGALADSHDGSSWTDATRDTPTEFGGGHSSDQSLPATNNWTGLIDEVTIYSIVQSSDVIELNYNNINNTSGFLTFGNIEIL